MKRFWAAVRRLFQWHPFCASAAPKALPPAEEEEGLEEWFARVEAEAEDAQSETKTLSPVEEARIRIQRGEIDAVYCAMCGSAGGAPCKTCGYGEPEEKACPLCEGPATASGCTNCGFGRKEGNPSDRQVVGFVHQTSSARVGPSRSAPRTAPVAPLLAVDRKLLLRDVEKALEAYVDADEDLARWYVEGPFPLKVQRGFLGSYLAASRRLQGLLQQLPYNSEDPDWFQELRPNHLAHNIANGFRVAELHLKVETPEKGTELLDVLGEALRPIQERNPRPPPARPIDLADLWQTGPSLEELEKAAERL